MTHLRNLMLEELERRNYSQSTARAYLMTIKDFARYFRQPPDTLGPQHIRQYQAYLFRERKLAANTVNQRVGALHPIEGSEEIARYLAGLAGRALNLTILERTVNGQPGLVAQQDGVTVTVFAFEVAADRITHIWAVRNPGKLRAWTAG